MYATQILECIIQYKIPKHKNLQHRNTNKFRQLPLDFNLIIKKRQLGHGFYNLPLPLQIKGINDCRLFATCLPLVLFRIKCKINIRCSCSFGLHLIVCT